MIDREELEAIRDYGPSGSIMETRAVVDSHLQALGTLEAIERLCVETKKDYGEIRWVRMFATDILKILDPAVDWHKAAYGSSS